MKVIGEFTSYLQLQELYRQRADALEFSRETIDRLAGFVSSKTGLPINLASRILSPNPTKKLGSDNFGMFAPALGLKLVAVEDEALMADIMRRITSGQISKRDNSRIMHAGTVHIKFSKRRLRKMQRKGGKNSRSKMSKRRASQLGRHAAKMRWHKPKLTEIDPVR